MAEPRATPWHRTDFPHLATLTTRWADNDVYGHINNVVYYAYFDSVVNGYLVRCGALDLVAGEVIGLVVETGCTYFAPAAFPESLEAGCRVTRIGTSSVRYEVAIFRHGQTSAIAQGYFVHVYVDRTTRKPVSLPPALRAAVGAIVVEAE